MKSEIEKHQLNMQHPSRNGRGIESVFNADVAMLQLHSTNR